MLSSQGTSWYAISTSVPSGFSGWILLFVALGKIHIQRLVQKVDFGIGS